MKARIHAIRDRLAEHRPFLLLLTAFIVFRFLALLALRPGGFIIDRTPDLVHYLEVGRITASGQLPFFDFWMEYPPLMPWLAALAYRLSLYIPPWYNPLFCFSLVSRLLLLPFDAGTLILIYASVRRIGTPEKALQVAGLWALLFAPIFTFLGWFESPAQFFLLLGIYGLLTDRPVLAGTAVGLGFMTKVFPAVIAPIGLFTLGSGRRRMTYVASAAVAAGSILLPPLIAAPQYTLAMFRVFLGRSSWESIWALLEGYTGYGAVAPLVVHTDPATASQSAHPAVLPWLLISAAFALLYLFLLTRRIKWGEKGRVASFALFSLALFVLYKGYSPQWTTYLGTLALLALPTGRGLGYALLLDMLMVAEWPIAFILLEGQSGLVAALIVLRTAAVLLMGLDSLARALPVARGWRAIQKATFPLALLIGGIGGLALLGSAGRVYTAQRLQDDSLAPFVSSLRASDSLPAPLVVLQPDLLERLSPHLPGSAIHLFPNVSGQPWAEADEWLPATLDSSERAWLLFDTNDQSRAVLFGDARAWFDANGCLAAEAWYNAAWAGSYVLIPAPEERSVGAAFEDGLRLVSATLTSRPLAPGTAACLHLAWRAERTPSFNYAVFVHLVDGDGRLVAQSDAWPPVPTSDWPLGEAITTAHALALPGNLPAGAYALRVGLYEIDSMRRLRLESGGDVVPLAGLVVK
jgi:hypothetical protein